MKYLLLAPTLLSVFLTAGPCEAAGQTMIDQMVIDNTNTRRKAEIYKSRRTATKSPTAVGARGASTNRAATTTRAATPKGTVYFGMDMYQQVLPEDPRGFVVHFTLTPAGGASPLRRTYNYVERQSERTAKFADVPKGMYNVSAQATLPGVGQRRIVFGTEIGSPSNPTGGRFASSITIEVRSGKDHYGNDILVASPETVYIRVVN